MSTQDGRPVMEAGLEDFAARRLRELNSLLAQHSPSPASVESNADIPNSSACLDLLAELEETSNDTSNGTTTPPHINATCSSTSPVIARLGANAQPNMQSQQQQRDETPVPRPPTQQSRSQPLPATANHPSVPSAQSQAQRNPRQQPQPDNATRLKLEPTSSSSPSNPNIPSARTRARARDSSQPTPKVEKNCDVCGCPNYCKSWSQHVTLCKTCVRLFSAKRDSVAPCSLDGKCPIEWRPYAKLCPSCRLRKAARLGIIEDEADHSAEPAMIHIEEGELDEDLQLQMALQISLAEQQSRLYQAEEEWEDYSFLLNDTAASVPATEQVLAIEGVPIAEPAVPELATEKVPTATKTQAVPTTREEPREPHEVPSRHFVAIRERSRSILTHHPAGGVFEDPPPEEPPMTVEDDFPANISGRFSRWLWDNMGPFSAGCLAVKRSEKESPRPEPVQTITFSNDLTDLQVNFVTQDLSVGELEPIEEISIPVMTITTNASLTSAGERQPGVPMRAGDAFLTQDKPKLTLTLETRRTTIDRRPMLKKLKTGVANPRNPNESTTVTTTSLIAPGEDCDEDEEEEEEA